LIIFIVRGCLNYFKILTFFAKISTLIIVSETQQIYIIEKYGCR